MVTDLGLDGGVVLTGPMHYEQVGELMRAAEVFALSAFHEPFGLVILEALACGCRIVTTDQGGPPCFIPAELRATGQAVLVSGLNSTSPTQRESEAFVSSLAGAVLSELSTPLDMPERQSIARTVQALTWHEYVRRLASIFSGAA